ncbi:hypothetical protein Syun_009850 [Stephania yunnanensis]|uniref:Ribonuclease H1 N-terminal domain-containing protein n=1 Tax=Stephania yunnanensis TaxID=152371 RepID=A0AAP0PSP2_9MAGN
MRGGTEEEEPHFVTTAVAKKKTIEQQPKSNSKKREKKWYTVFRGWDPGVYGTWYECYKQGINFDMFYYAHFDTKEETITGFDRYNHAVTIAREVHDLLTLEEALAELYETPHHHYHRECGLKCCTRRKEYLYHDHHLLTRNLVLTCSLESALYQRVGSGYEYVMDPWWSD